MMTKYLWPLAMAVITVLAGVALLLLPFALHANAGGWNPASTTDLWSGIGLIVIGLITFFAWYKGLRETLIEQGLIKIQRPDAIGAESRAPSSAADSSVELDRLLRPLAESVLRDLTAQLAAKEGSGRGGNIS